MHSSVIMHDDEFDGEAGRLRRTEHHELRNAAIASGAFVGAAVGMVGGPIGMGAGGVVGALLGLVGGYYGLERQDRRDAEHDRELDETIGVTSQNLGAHDMATVGMNWVEANDNHVRAVQEGELLEMETQLEEATLTTRWP